MRKEQVEVALPFLGKIQGLKRLHAGSVNSVYEARSSHYGLVIVKCYQLSFKEQVRVQFELLKRLRLPVPRFIEYRGNIFFRIDDRLCVVYKKLVGNISDHPSKGQRKKVGIFLAQFHRNPAVRKFIGTKRKMYALNDRRLRDIVSISRIHRLPHQQLLGDLVKEARECRLPSGLPSGGIHVDLKPSNALFRKDELTGVLDFDNMYRGPFLLDLAKSMIWFGMVGKKFNASVAKDVLQGYDQIRPLTFIERSLLYKALCFAFVSHVIVDFEMFALGFTSVKYFQFITGDFVGVYRDFRRVHPDIFLNEG